MEVQNEVKIPKAVVSVLEWWCAAMRPILGNKVTGIYLYGGIPLGDFAPMWSNLNLLITCKSPILPYEAQQVSMQQAQFEELYIRRRIGSWRSWRGVDCHFVTEYVLEYVGGEAPCFYSSGTSGTWYNQDPLTPFERYLLAKHSILWAGKPANRITLPDKRSLITHTEERLKYLTEEHLALQSPEWFCNATQELARQISFWRRRKVVTKKEALKNEAARNNLFKNVFEHAMTIRSHGNVGLAVELPELRSDFTELLPVATELITGLLENARQKIN